VVPRARTNYPGFRRENRRGSSRDMGPGRDMAQIVGPNRLRARIAGTKRGQGGHGEMDTIETSRSTPPSPARARWILGAKVRTGNAVHPVLGLPFLHRTPSATARRVPIVTLRDRLTDSSWQIHPTEFPAGSGGALETALQAPYHAGAKADSSATITGSGG